MQIAQTENGTGWDRGCRRTLLFVLPVIAFLFEQFDEADAGGFPLGSGSGEVAGFTEGNWALTTGSRGHAAA